MILFELAESLQQRRRMSRIPARHLSKEIGVCLVEIIVDKDVVEKFGSLLQKF